MLNVIQVRGLEDAGIDGSRFHSNARKDQAEQDLGPRPPCRVPVARELHLVKFREPASHRGQQIGKGLFHVPPYLSRSVGASLLDPSRGLNLSLNFHSILMEIHSIANRFPARMKKRLHGRGRIVAVRQTADLVYAGSTPTPGSIFSYRFLKIVILIEVQVNK